MSLSETTLSYIETIKGFMDPEEGRALHDMALSVLSDFPYALSVDIKLRSYRLFVVVVGQQLLQ